MSAQNGFPGSQGWPGKSPNAQNAADSNDTRQTTGQPAAWQQHRAPSPPYLGPAAGQHEAGASAAPAPHGAGQQQWPNSPQSGGYAQPQNYGQAGVHSLSQVISQSQNRGPAQSYTPPPYAAQPAAPPVQQNPSYAPQFESAFQNHAPPRAAAQQPQAPDFAHARQAAPPPHYAPSPGYGSAPGQSYPHPQAAQWPSAPSRDYEIGSYMPPQPRGYQNNATAEREPTLNDWGQAAEYSDDQHRQPGVDDLGFAQAAGGELDPAYGEDDQDYDYEEPPRRRRPALVMVALAGAVLVGGGLAYGYKMVVGDSGGGQPPVIKSALEPSKTKPADAGGKQFAHSDSKLMGRLGEGAGAGSVSVAASASADASDQDSSGTRKVATLVVGRDGTIQAPPAAQLAPASTGVPGLTVVDALAPQAAIAAPAPVAPPAATPAEPQVVNAGPQKVVVTPPLAAPQPPPQSTGSVSDAGADVAPPSPPPVKPKKIAAAAPAAAEALAAPKAAASPTGANGYVAVLASVPTSSSSRMDALKRYADMQQKYASLLTGKTPDVTEANLGAKGNYHRLVVGPPSSRDQASSLCSQLKSQGYNDCWVTAY